MKIGKEYLTFVMVKPEGHFVGFGGRYGVSYVANKIEQNGMRVIALRQTKPDRMMVAAHYAEHKDKEFFPKLIKKFVGSRCTAMLVAGDETVAKKMKTLLGATDPTKAKKGTIRQEIGKTLQTNACHASADAESAEREIRLWFPDATLLYSKSNRNE